MHRAGGPKSHPAITHTPRDHETIRRGAATRFQCLGPAQRLDRAGRTSLGDVYEERGLLVSDSGTDLILRGGANIVPAGI